MYVMPMRQVLCNVMITQHVMCFRTRYVGFSKVEGGHWVVCPRGGGPPRIAIDDNRAHITVLACVTMTGATLEPMFIVKGKSERVYPDIISKLTKQHVIATGHIIHHSTSTHHLGLLSCVV